MLDNILLSGGTTMMSGFSNRIKLDLPNALESDLIFSKNYQVVAENNRDISVWTGASMISSMSSFDDFFIKKEDYIENGENRMSLFSKIL